MRTELHYEFNMANLRHRKSLMRPGKKGMGAVLPWVLAGVLLVVLFTMPVFESGSGAAPPVPPRHPASLREILLPLLPYVVIFAEIFGFPMWQLRWKGRYQRAFVESSKLGEAHHAALSNGGMTLRTPDA